MALSKGFSGTSLNSLLASLIEVDISLVNINIFIYNNFAGKLWNLYFQRVLQAKLVEGTRGEVQILTSRKVVVYNFIAFCNTK